MNDTNYFFQKGTQNEMTDEDLSMLFLMPLVQMAWAHGAISPREKQIIFEAAREENIDERHALNDTLDQWLVYQPSRRFFDECLSLIKNTLQAMTVKEREQKRDKIFERCRRVASAAGDKSLMDVNHRISPEEKELLTTMMQSLN